MNSTRFRSLLSAVLVVGMGLLSLGCPGRPGTRPPVATLPQTETKSGTAVVVLVDTSGSMAQTVPDQEGKQRPKEDIAREALDQIISNTAKWEKETPGRTLEMALFTFSSSVSAVLPMQKFDEAKARESLARIPKAGAGTAIGRALERGYQAVYQSGRKRKFIVCVSDGMNTSGPAPENVARQFHSQTKGAVELHFVAFDTSSRYFDFLKKVNGHIVEAADGKQLGEQLGQIYEKRILAEDPESE